MLHLREWEREVKEKSVEQSEYNIYALSSPSYIGTVKIIIGARNDNPLQYSYLENPMDRGGWQTIVYVGHKELDTTEWLDTQL